MTALIDKSSPLESVNFHGPMRSIWTHSQGSGVFVAGGRRPYLGLGTLFLVQVIHFFTEELMYFFYQWKIEMICDCSMCTSCTRTIEVMVIPLNYFEL